MDDRRPVNRAERMRKRGWNEARAGRIERYWTCANLSLERIRDTETEWRNVLEEA